MVALTFGNSPITLQVGENTGAARRAAADAAASLAGVQGVLDDIDVAVGAVTQLFDTFQQRAAGILEAGFFMGRAIRTDTAVDTFFTEICGDGDDGSFDITLLDDGYPVAGPITVSTAGGPETSNPGVTIAAGSNVSCWIENVTGTVTAFYSKAEGLPA